MRKFLWMTALIAVLALLFVGCDDGGGGGGSKDPAGWKFVFDKNTTDTVTGMPTSPLYLKKDGTEKVTEPATNPSRTGYTFDGWYNSATGAGAKYNFTSFVTAHKTIYAGWKLIPVLQGNLGSYTFISGANQVGWLTNGYDNTATSLLLTTVLNAQTLELTMDVAPNNVVQFVWQGDAATSSWNQADITDANGAIKSEYAGKASYNATTKIFSISIPDVLPAYAELMQCKESVKLVFAFHGTGGVETLGITKADLIAKAAPIDYKWVTFDTDGGTPAEYKRFVTSGQALGDAFPPTPIKAGSHLTSWNNVVGGAVFTKDTTVTADITVKATWAAGEPVTYTVQFATDGGTPATIPQITVSEGSAMGAALPAGPAKAGGVVFAGWVDKTDSNKVYNETTAVTKSMTLTATWQNIVMPKERDATKPPTGFKLKSTLTVYAGNTVASLSDWAAGKGNVEADDVAKIKAEDNTSVLLVYAYNDNSSYTVGWGGGGIGKVGEGGDSLLGINVQSIDGKTFYQSFSISSVKTKLGTDTRMQVNFWSGTVGQGIEIWEVDPDYEDSDVIEVGDMEFEIAKNHEWTATNDGPFSGWQKLIPGLFDGRTLTQGDEWQITFEFEISKAVGKIEVFLIDPSSGTGNNWWIKLSDSKFIGNNIDADTKEEVNISFPITTTSVSGQNNYNQICFQMGKADLDEEENGNRNEKGPTMKITNMVLTKK